MFDSMRKAYEYNPQQADYRIWLVVNPATWLLPMLSAVLAVALLVHLYAFSLPGQGWHAPEAAAPAPAPEAAPAPAAPEAAVPAPEAAPAPAPEEAVTPVIEEVTPAAEPAPIEAVPALEAAPVPESIPTQIVPTPETA